MGGRIVTLVGMCAVALGLASCSNDNGSDRAASAPATVTVTAPAADAPSQAKRAVRKKKAAKQAAKGSSPVVEAPKATVEKSAPTSGSGGRTKQSGDNVPAGKVEATNSSPPEVTLAVIDAENAYVTKSNVHRYAVLLDRLEASCDEAREQLAESSLTASRDTRGMNVQLSILDVLKEVVAAHPSGVCIDTFARVAKRDTAP